MSAQIPRPQRAHRRRLPIALTLAAAFVLVAAPVTQAANATNINVQLPAGFSIAGTITDNTGAALPNASVYAFGSGSASYGFATADGTGKYKVEGLNAGSYSVSVSAPTGKNLVDGYYTTANASHHTPLSSAATKVAVGPNKTGINVKLPAGMSISGKVTNTAGTALANAQVYASGVSFDYFTTGADGMYTLKGLAAGSYRLSLYAPANSNYQSGFYTSANANKFTIAIGSATGITVGPNKTGVNVKLPTGFTISGTIKNTSGVALAGVGIQPSSSTYYGRGVVTDATGKYTIKGLAAATYKLGISPDSASQYMDGYYTTTNANHFTSAIAGASGVAVGPNKTGINANIVTGRTIAGTITTTGGAPILGATVSATNLGHTRTAMTDATGKYTIKGLSSASQTLDLDPPYGQNFMRGWYTTGNTNHFTTNSVSATPIVVPPNATGVNMKIPKGYSIAGKITGPGAVPIDFAYVDASKPGYTNYASTETDGTYLINGLGSGSYVVAVQAFDGNFQSGFYTTGNTAHFTINEASATKVVIGP